MAKRKRKNAKKRNLEVNDNKETNKRLISYLKTWKNDRDKWKFEKVKQVRLVTGMFDSTIVPDDIFPIFVEYIENSKGKIKETVISKATTIINEMEKWASLSDEEQESLTKPDTNKYTRARTVMQIV